MIRLTFSIVLFLLSLLTIFRAPTHLLWYISILVTEFSWIFFLVNLVLVVVAFYHGAPGPTVGILALVSSVLFSIPIFKAFKISSALPALLANSFQTSLAGSSAPPFALVKMLRA